MGGRGGVPGDELDLRLLGRGDGRHIEDMNKKEEMGLAKGRKWR